MLSFGQTVNKNDVEIRLKIELGFQPILQIDISHRGRYSNPAYKRARQANPVSQSSVMRCSTDAYAKSRSRI